MSESVCVQCQAKGSAVKRRRGYAAVSWGLFALFVVFMVVQYLDSAHWSETTGRLYPNAVYDAGGLVWTWRISFGVWLAHVLFRAATGRKVCPTCGATDAMVPENSPRGQQLLAGGK